MRRDSRSRPGTPLLPGRGSRFTDPEKPTPTASKERVGVVTCQKFSVALGALGIHFAETGGLATQRAQIIQFGAAHVRRTQHFNLVDDLRMGGKDALDALPKAHLAHSEAGLVSVALGNDDPFERLQALLVAFLDLHVDPDGVAGLKVGEIGAPRLGEKPVNNRDRKSTRLNSSHLGIS